MDAACFQPHQCLGDARQFQQLKEQQTQLELERLRQQQQHGQQQVDPTPAGMASIDPSTVNPDVWAAASLLGDKGVQLIQIYRELEECREAAVQQMALNTSMRTLTQQQQQQQQQQQDYQQQPGSLAASSGFGEPAAGSAVGQLLSQPTVMDAIKQSHDARVMSAWEAQQAVWQRQAHHLAAVSAKDPGQLALNAAGPDWRSKQELLSALEVAVPAAAVAAHRPNRASVYDSGNRAGHDGDKGSIQDGGPAGSVACAGGNWMSSLRNANERLLQIGNIFSGLYLSVRNTSTVAAAGLTAISKPSEEAFAPHIPGQKVSWGADAVSADCGSSGGSGGLGSTAGGSSSQGGLRALQKSTSQRGKWSKEPYLQDKLKAGAAAVKVLQSHTPDASQLAVRGWSIEWALASSPLTQRPVGLGDVERRLAVADPALWMEYQAAQQREASKAAAAAAAAQQAARRAAARAAGQQLPRPGPHLEASASQLAMHFSIPAAGDHTAPLATPTARTSWAALGSEGGAAGAAAPAAGAVAKLTLTSTGTAAVYYSWVSQGRQRLPLAEAGAGGAQHSSEHAGPAAAAAAVAATATAAGHPQSYLFTMPDMQGVILPGESKTFRFCFTASSPGVFHEAWSCYTHPPLEPPPDRSRRTGEPLALELKGVAVADGNSGGPTLVAAEQLRRRVDAKTRDMQVKSVLSSILSSVQQQVAQRSAQQQGSGSDNTLPGYDAAVAAKWAAANPPGSCGCCSSGGGDASSSEQGPSQEESQPEGEGAVQQQQQQHQAGGSSQPLCLHYYSPALHAQLSEVYSKARALLQPTPPVVEPPKKGAAGPAGGPKAKAKEAAAPAEPPEPLLPEAWDCSISNLRGLLARLRGAQATPPQAMPQQGAGGPVGQGSGAAAAASAPAAAGAVGGASSSSSLRQAGAVLQQQMEVALRAAAVPDSRRQLVEAAVRHLLLRLSDSVEEAAAAVQASAVLPPSGEPSSLGNRTHRSKGGGGETHRAGHRSSGGGTAAARAGAKGAAGGAHGEGRAEQASQQQQPEGRAYLQQLHDEVWGECQSALSGFEGLLREFEGAAAAAVDAQAAAFGGSGDYEGVAWRMFAAARKKQQLGIADAGH